MNAADAHALVGDATFLDVREPFEFAAGHVEGSLHIPIGQIGARWEDLPRDDRLVVVCHVGQRSALVADFLRRQGFDAHNLEGGLEEWVAEGFDLAPGEPADRRS